MTLFQQMNNQRMNNIMNNPQLNQVMDFIKQSGKSPKDLFYEECNKRGVDPDMILNKLR